MPQITSKIEGAFKYELVTIAPGSISPGGLASMREMVRRSGLNLVVEADGSVWQVSRVGLIDRITMFFKSIKFEGGKDGRGEGEDNKEGS